MLVVVLVLLLLLLLLLLLFLLLLLLLLVDNLICTLQSRMKHWHAIVGANVGGKWF